MEEQISSSLSNLTEKLSGWVDSLIVNLPNIFIATIVFTLAYWLSGNIQGWANRLLKKVVKQQSIRGLLVNVIAILVIAIGILLALAVLNLDGTLKSLLAGAGVAGLAISLALQGTLSNTFSGVFIAIKDEINLGDWIVTQGIAGKVVEIDLRNTKLKESDNNIAIIPNKLILENPFKNFGLTNRIRTDISCGVAYSSDLKDVKQVATKAIEELYPQKNGEKVELYYTEFGDSSINFSLRFFVDAKENRTAIEVKSESIMAIKEAFDRNGIEIPYPTHELIVDKSTVNDFAKLI